MKKEFLFLLFFALTLYHNTMAQNIIGAEYFIDTDPGVGMGNFIAIPSAASVEMPISIGLNNVSAGAHKLGWRVKNNLGKWSHYESRLFYVFPIVTNTSSNLIAGEWFLDTDPGVGNGTSFLLSASTANVDQNLPIVLNNVTEGAHKLCVRMKNQAGKWSHYESRLFYVFPIQNNIAEPQIVSGEWFVDTDPGIDNGYSFNVTPGTNIDLTMDLTLTSIAVGEHTLYVRVKDANGKWTHYEGRAITVNNCVPVTETCNNLDDDCDGTIDNGLSFVNYYNDLDSDTYGAGTANNACQSPGAAYVTNDTDCNDNNASINTGATEICGNGIDEDCSGADLSCSNSPTVLGFSPSEACAISSLITISGTNLSDVIEVQIGGVTSGGIMSSSATEIVVMLGNGQTGNITVITSSGSAISNDLFTVIPSIYYSYEDADGDTYGDPSTEFIYCEIPFGYVTNNTDCVDNNSAINPGASETCNNFDDDCDGTVDNGLSFVDYYNDLDGDTYGAGTANNACQSPGATYVTNNTDCNNNNAAIKPGATEICGNGIDEDCSGSDLICPSTGDLTVTNVLSIGNYGTGTQTTFNLHFTSGTDNIESPGPGADIWFQFTAQSNAIRIQLNGATNADDDLDVSLYDYTTTTGEALIPLDIENDVTPTNLGISTDGGNEILYYDQLEVGSTYWICVRNVNNTFGPATMKIAYLRGSAMDIGAYTNYTNTYSSTCQNFKCKYKPGASYYTFNLWNGNVAQNEPYWIYSTAPATTSVASTVVQLGKLVGANINNIPVQHSIKVDAHYALKDAYGNTEQVVGYGITPGVFTLNAEADLNLRTTDRCPVYKSPTTGSLATNRSVCGTTRYIWELTMSAPTAGLPQTVNGPIGGSRVLAMSTIPGISNNQQYNVSISSLHVDQQTQSNYGTTQCMRTYGFAGAPIIDGNDNGNENENERAGADEQSFFHIELYPNPNGGERVVLNTNGMEGEMTIIITDAMGRQIEQMTKNIEGDYYQQEITFQETLSSGLYQMTIKNGAQVQSIRMVVSR
jgi:Putative metal-binding motif/Secretion system C-terminal sorting domain/IPT/TIG domain